MRVVRSFGNIACGSIACADPRACETATANGGFWGAYTIDLYDCWYQVYLLHNVDALVVHLLFKGHLCSELFTMVIPFDQGHPQLVEPVQGVRYRSCRSSIKQGLSLSHFNLVGHARQFLAFTGGKKHRVPVSKDTL